MGSTPSEDVEAPLRRNISIFNEITALFAQGRVDFSNLGFAPLDQSHVCEFSLKEHLLV